MENSNPTFSSSNSSTNNNTTTTTTTANDSKITLHVKQTNGTIIDHCVDDLSVLVEDLKSSLSELTEIPVGRIRLMVKSTILADDKPLDFYGIEDGCVLRLVQLAGSNAKNSARTRDLSGISNSNASSSSASSQTNALSSQAHQLFLSNPRLAQTMMMANPHMRRAIEENPELRKIMSDPSIMRQSLDAAQNPQLMQEVQRNNDRALSNLESAPGGYAHIRRMYHSIQEPLNQAARDSSRTPLDDLNKRRAKILGVSKPNPDRVNTMPLPNPWAKRRRPSVGTAPASSSSSVATTRRSMASTAADQVSRSADRLALLDISSARHTTPSAAESRAAEMRDPLGIMQMHEQMGSLPSFMSAMEESGMVRRSGRGLSVDAGAPEHHHSSQEPPSQSNDRHQQGAATADMSEDELDRFQRQFQSELDQLEEMGFIDRSKNLKALIETNGDLSLAINIITGEDD